ncbi:hypothetical protein [Streptomyces xylophagus]|uniref:hypothetical protein n=1 Tax=Streptomyces xylophagus TaxID=285514 RepID=UPI0005B7E2C0|nr:hypothetical protein [Streptomyces xylophagus]
MRRTWSEDDGVSYLVTAALLGAVSVGPAQAVENGGGLELSALSFSPSTVDVTAGGAVATLN